MPLLEFVPLFEIFIDDTPGFDMELTDDQASQFSLEVGPHMANGIGGLVTGPEGPQGIQGIQGETGLTGLTGADSTVPGPQGIQGIQGETGATGADSVVVGPQGDQGIQGIQGITGDTGPAGEDGLDGTNFTVDVVDTLANQNLYDAELQGFAMLASDTGDLYLRETATAGVWSAPIPFRGPTGLTGVQGVQGIQGIQGDAGTNGTIGVDGDSAYDIAVAAGYADTEANWLLSLVGADGADSTVVGPQGIQGIQGDTGPDGPEGPAGSGIAKYTRLGVSSPITITSANTAVPIIWDTEISDELLIYNSANPERVTPNAGVYDIDVRVQFADVSTSGLLRASIVQYNSSGVQQELWDVGYGFSPTYGACPVQAISAIGVVIAAGDYIVITVRTADSNYRLWNDATFFTIRPAIGAEATSYPAFTGEAGNILAVNAGETDVEWVAKPADGADGAVGPTGADGADGVSGADGAAGNIQYVAYGNSYVVNTSSTLSSSAAATKGSAHEMLVDRVFTGGSILVGADPTATYTMVVVKLVDADPTFAVESVLWESAATVVNNVETHRESFVTDERIILLAGKRYGFVLVRKDGTGTAACEIPFSGAAQSDEARNFDVALGALWFETNSPSIGDALYINTTSVPSWTLNTATLVLEEIFPEIAPGDAGKVVGVNAGETAYELIDAGGSAIVLGTTITASRDLVNGDLAGSIFYDLNGNNIRLTVPPSLTGTEPMTVQTVGAGEVDFEAGAGVTIQSLDSLLGLAGQFASATLIPKGSNVYGLVGALKASAVVITPASYTMILPTGYTDVGGLITNTGANRVRTFAYGPALTGKSYWELDRGNPVSGNATDSYPGLYGVTDAPTNYENNTVGTIDATGFGRSAVGNCYVNGVLDGGQQSWSGLNVDEILMFAYDADAEKLWIGTNGVWQDDPSAGTGGFDFSSFAAAAGGLCVAINCRQANVAFELKTTTGTLDHTIPTGFSPLA